MPPPTDATRHVAGWTIADCRVTGGRLTVTGQCGLSAQLCDELARTITATGLPSGALPLSRHLVFLGPAHQGDRRRLIVIGDDALRDLLGEHMTEGCLAPSELRLLKQMLGGCTLHEAAEADGVGYETKRSQYKSLARKLGVHSQVELIGLALTRIMLHLDGLGGALASTAHRIMPGANEV